MSEMTKEQVAELLGTALGGLEPEASQAVVDIAKALTESQAREAHLAKVLAWRVERCADMQRSVRVMGECYGRLAVHDAVACDREAKLREALTGVRDDLTHRGNTALTRDCAKRLSAALASVTP